MIKNIQFSISGLLVALLLPTLLTQAQTHGLCNNSGGFRLTKQQIQNDEDIAKVSPNLANKLVSGEDLTGLEDHFFFISYKKIGANVLVETNDEVRAIGLANQFYVGSGESSIAIDAVISGSMNSDQAAHFAVNTVGSSIRKEVELVEKPALSNFHMVDSMIEQGYTDIQLNGEILPANVQSKITAAQLHHLNFDDAKTLLTQQLDPAELDLFYNIDTPEDFFARLPDQDVGDTSYLTYRVRFKVDDETFFEPIHTILVQKITPKDLLFFIPGENRVPSFVLPRSTADAFSRFLRKISSDVLDQHIDAVYNAENLPLNNELRADLIAINKAKMKQIYGVAFSRTEGDIVTELDPLFKSMSHGPPR